MSSEPAQINVEGKTALELHNSGGRCYALQDYPTAVQYLSRASELGVKEFGDPLHDDMGVIYLLYGKSLLELTREEGDPLGENVPKDVPVGEEEAEEEEAEGEEEEESPDGDHDDEEEEMEDDEPAADDVGDGGKKEKEAGGDKKAEDENAKNEDEEEKKKGDVQGTASGVEFNGEKGDGKIDGDAMETKEDGDDAAETSDKEEDPSDLQLAWEILELAKIIFAKRGDSGKAYLADTMITLGEISMESENIESAVTDIKEAVEILKTMPDANGRVLAEAYYKLGMAVAMDNKIEEAVEHYNSSKQMLENRIKSLENSERALHRREVEDMRKLLPEIDEKVADLRSFHEEQLKRAAEDPRPILPGSPEKKASDISHLVKRKRKSEDEGTAGSSSDPLPKKPALD